MSNGNSYPDGNVARNSDWLSNKNEPRGAIDRQDKMDVPGSVRNDLANLFCDLDTKEKVNEAPTNSTDRQRISSSEISGNHALPDNRSYAVRDIRREMFVNEKEPETTVDTDRNTASVGSNNDNREENPINEILLSDFDKHRNDNLDNARVPDSDVKMGLDVDGDSNHRRDSGMARLHKGKKSKTISTKLEADWLKRIFPKVIKGEKGHFAIKNSGAGFDVYFRVDKRQTKAEPINLKFPYLTRETFLTWKGLSNEQARKAAEKYVRGYILDAIASGDNRARIVAGKLSDVA